MALPEEISFAAEKNWKKWPKIKSAVAPKPLRSQPNPLTLKDLYG